MKNQVVLTPSDLKKPLPPPRKHGPISIPLLWVLIALLASGLNFSDDLRYLVQIIVPASILAGIGVNRL